MPHPMPPRPRVRKPPAKVFTPEELRYMKRVCQGCGTLHPPLYTCAGGWKPWKEPSTVVDRKR